MTEKLKQAHGKWVTGDSFWDREEDIALFAEKVDEGAHILLVAQRRMGKTSLMHEAAGRLGDRYVCVFVDLQKACCAADAIAELSIALRPHKPIWHKTREVFANVLATVIDRIERIGTEDLGVTLRAGLNAGNWRAKGDQLLAILAASDRPVVLLLDEVPIMVNRMLKGDDFKITPERRRGADEFMSWLRKNSLQHQGKVRIVVSGSIGFEPILHQAHLSSTINNFAPFELKPWSEEQAVGCLHALASQYGLEFRDGAEVRMVKRLASCIPHHVQMFFEHAYTWCRRKGHMVFTPRDAEEVYKTDMLGARGHAELTHYEERLKMVLGDEVLPLAIEMLTEAAVLGRLTGQALEVLQKDYAFEGLAVAEVQKEILWVLEHDGYLRLSKKGYAFVSRLLRDWWKERHRSFYTPILKRGG